MRLTAFSALLVLSVAPAAAQTAHNSAAPIDFGADHIELQDKANRAILTGSVSVRQAEMTLNAARMTVAYTGQVVATDKASRAPVARAEVFVIVP